MINELLNQCNPTDDSICDIVLLVIQSRKSKNLSQHDLASQAKVDVEDLKHFESFQFAKVSLDSFSKILFASGILLKVEE